MAVIGEVLLVSQDPVAAGNINTVIQKTGTSGTAVMQKAKAGWTSVTGKTGTSATAIAQKALAGWTKVSGH